MQQIVININDKENLKFILNLLSKFDFVSSVNFEKKAVKKMVDSVSLLSEKSLAEEWDSKEDSRWDNIL